MRYVTTCELNNIIRKNLAKIPHDVDLVVGVPRSGMLPATIIALLLNKRLSDVDSFAEGKIYDAGCRGEVQQWGNVKKVLVVDDSVNMGLAMGKTKAKLANVSSNTQITYLAIIASSVGVPFVDQYLELIDGVRVFEWNLFHHYLMEHACLDIDGVLNEDPTNDDDGPIYLDFLNNTRPLNLPTVEVDTLISCRLEKYRLQTEQWLSEHGVRYKHLILLDLPDKPARLSWGKHGEYKANYFRKSNCILFIESSYYQAQTIANISGKSVICLETNELMQFQIGKNKKFLKSKFPNTFSLLKRLLKPNKHK